MIKAEKMHIAEIGEAKFERALGRARVAVRHDSR